MKRILSILCGLLILYSYSPSSLAIQDKDKDKDKEKEVTPSFPAYVDSDLCARLMLGPITTQRVDCSVKTYKDGSNPVLVRLDDNTIFSVNKEKMVKDYVGGFGEASGDIKVKSGTMKLKGFTPIERSQIPEGPATKLLDVRTYQAKGSAQLHEKVRHELAMIAYITTFDFIRRNSAPGSVVVCDYVLKDVLEGKSQRYYAATYVVYAVERLGEPFVFGWTPAGAAAWVKKRGLRVVEDIDHKELTRRHLTGSNGKPDGRVLDWQRIIKARVP